MTKNNNKEKHFNTKCERCNISILVKMKKNKEKQRYSIKLFIIY